MQETIQPFAHPVARESLLSTTITLFTVVGKYSILCDILICRALWWPRRRPVGSKHYGRTLRHLWCHLCSLFIIQIHRIGLIFILNFLNKNDDLI